MKGRKRSIDDSARGDVSRRITLRQIAPIYSPEIPDHVIDEANRARSAGRTLTSMILGDPAPGRSALDKMGG